MNRFDEIVEIAHFIPTFEIVLQFFQTFVVSGKSNCTKQGACPMILVVSGFPCIHHKTFKMVISEIID